MPRERRSGAVIDLFDCSRDSIRFANGLSQFQQVKPLVGRRGGRCAIFVRFVKTIVEVEPVDVDVDPRVGN